MRCAIMVRYCSVPRAGPRSFPGVMAGTARLRCGSHRFSTPGDQMKSIAFKAAFVGLALACTGMSTAFAQAKPYPHKNVTIVTHSSPGGGSDVFVRELVKYLGPAMNVNFAVENV